MRILARIFTRQRVGVVAEMTADRNLLLVVGVLMLASDICRSSDTSRDLEGVGGDEALHRTSSVYIDNNGDLATKSMFKPTLRNITVSPGERAILRCKVENLGTKTVTWRKRDEIHPLTIGMYPFAPDTRITVDYNQRAAEWLLIIQDVRPTDEGYYCCQISTKHDRDTYDIRLNVRTIQVSGDEYIEAGSPIHLICNATGRPEPPHNVDWFKDGVKIVSDAHSGVIITKKIETRVLVSMLSIKHSKETDSGVYVCRSSNDEEGSFVVHILSGPPTSIDKEPEKPSYGSYASAGQSLLSLRSSRSTTVAVAAAAAAASLLCIGASTR